MTKTTSRHLLDILAEVPDFRNKRRDIQLSNFGLDFHRQAREKKLSHHIVGWVERIPPKAYKSEKTETVSKTGIFTRDRVKPNAFGLS